MAAATERFIHLSRPLASVNTGIQTNIAPLTVNIQPQVPLPLDTVFWVYPAHTAENYVADPGDI